MIHPGMDIISGEVIKCTLITLAQKPNTGGAAVNIYIFALLGSHSQLAKGLCTALVKQPTST